MAFRRFLFLHEVILVCLWILLVVLIPKVRQSSCVRNRTVHPTPFFQDNVWLTTFPFPPPPTHPSPVHGGGRALRRRAGDHWWGVDARAGKFRQKDRDR